jgi:hypothetical protein
MLERFFKNRMRFMAEYLKFSIVSVIQDIYPEVNFFKAVNSKSFSRLEEKNKLIEIFQPQIGWDAKGRGQAYCAPSWREPKRNPKSTDLFNIFVCPF